MSSRQFVKVTALFTTSLVLALILLEVGLRLITPYPITSSSNKRIHPRLAYTLSPRLHDVDQRGFRNTIYTLEDADLVIIGDSQTYGENVTSENNFPSLVASKTSRNVYNFGISSYGIYQYKVLMDDVLQYPVKDVILSLYPANDLAFDCEILSTDYWKSYAKKTGLPVPGCGGDSKRERATTVAKINKREGATTIVRIKRLFQKTATLQLLNILPTKVGVRQPRENNFDQRFFLFDEDQFVSKGRSRDHAASASLEDPDVRINFENSKRFLIEDAKRADDKSIGFLVLIIPSKERVLYEWMTRRDREVTREFAAVVKNELSLTQEYVRFFEKNEIVYVDALLDVVIALDRAVKDGGQLYPDGNGHPLRVGYQAYADAAIKGLDSLR